MGTFIVLEGGEGCGKSTQARLLYSRLLQEGFPSLLLHEPGGTPLGEQIRRLLKAQRGESQKTRQNTRQANMSPLTELLLFSAARAELVNNVMRPALEGGRTVVCDRFTPSTIAYQGYGRGQPLETIDLVNRLTTADLEPDLLILLDMTAEEGLRRVEAQTSLELDTEVKPLAYRRDEDGARRFEEEPLSFHRKVRSGYLELVKAEPERWFVVDGALPQDKIAELIWQRVDALVRSRAG
ncbi:MAG: dTMP kinase [Dehalococcoidia bacterium]